MLAFRGPEVRRGSFRTCAFSGEWRLTVRRAAWAEGPPGLGGRDRNGPRRSAACLSGLGRLSLCYGRRGLFAVGTREPWLQRRRPVQGEGELSKWPTLSGQPLEAGVRPVEPVEPQHHFADAGLHLLPLEEHRVLRGASRGHRASWRTCWGDTGADMCVVGLRTSWGALDCDPGLVPLRVHFTAELS